MPVPEQPEKLLRPSFLIFENIPPLSRPPPACSFFTTLALALHLRPSPVLPVEGATPRSRRCSRLAASHNRYCNETLYQLTLASRNHTIGLRASTWVISSSRSRCAQTPMTATQIIQQPIRSSTLADPSHRARSPSAMSASAWASTIARQARASERRCDVCSPVSRPVVGSRWARRANAQRARPGARKGVPGVVSIRVVMCLRTASVVFCRRSRRRKTVSLKRIYSSWRRDSHPRSLESD